MCFILWWERGERLRKRETDILSLCLEGLHIFKCIYLIDPHTFSNQLEVGFHGGSLKNWRAVNHRPVFTSAIFSLSVSASRSLLLELLTLWTALVLVWHISPRSSPRRVGCMLAHACVFSGVGTRTHVYGCRFIWCSPSLLTRTHTTQQFAYNLLFFSFVHCTRNGVYVDLLYISSENEPPPSPQKKTCTLILMYHTNDNILYKILNNSLTRYMCVYAWTCDYRCYLHNLNISM